MHPNTIPPPPAPADVEAEILRLAGARGAASSICPSEVARALAPADWRPLMRPVRDAAAALSRAGRLDILRKGRPVPPEAMRGVIRLRVPPGS